MRLTWLETSPPIAVVWREGELTLDDGDRARTFGAVEFDGEAPRDLFRAGGWLGIITREAIWGVDLVDFEVAQPRRLGRRHHRNIEAVRALWEQRVDVDLDDPAAVDALLRPEDGIDREMIDSGLAELDPEVLESELDDVRGGFADPNAPWFVEHHGGALFEVWRLDRGAVSSHLFWLTGVEVTSESYARGVVRAHEPALYLFFEDHQLHSAEPTGVYRVPLDAPRSGAERKAPGPLGDFTMSPRGPWVALWGSDEPTYAHAPHLHVLTCAQITSAPAPLGVKTLLVHSHQLERQAMEPQDDPVAYSLHQLGASSLREVSFSDQGDTVLATFNVMSVAQTLILDLRSGDVAHVLVGERAQRSESRELRAGVVTEALSAETWVYDRRGRSRLPFRASALTSTGDGEHWLVTTAEEIKLWSARRGSPVLSWSLADAEASGRPLRAPALASISPDARALLTLGEAGEQIVTPLPERPATEGPTRSSSALILWCLSRLTSPANRDLQLGPLFEHHFNSEYLAALTMWAGLDESTRRDLGTCPAPVESARPITEDVRARAQIIASRRKRPRGGRPDTELIAALMVLRDAHPDRSSRPALETALLSSIGLSIDLEAEAPAEQIQRPSLARLYRSLVDDGVLVDLPPRRDQAKRLLQRVIQSPSMVDDVACALSFIGVARGDVTDALKAALADPTLVGQLNLDIHGASASRALIRSLLDHGHLELVSGADPDVLLVPVAAIVHGDGTPARLAVLLGGGLLDHDAVMDIYLSDEALEKVIVQHIPEATA